MTDQNLIQNLREDYQKDSLDKKEAHKNPIHQFAKWFEEALSSQVPEPNAMVIASVNSTGFPSARVVLLKGYDEKGFIFYTNYDSQKGQELIENPKGALVFNWLELQRQIRIEGTVEKITPEESSDYFQKRPKKSQIGAWASPQSHIIKDRMVLEQNVLDLEAQYANAEQLPRPEHWGGFRVIPHRVEFWQGRSSRLHDRLNYTKTDSGSWKIVRLAP